MEGAEINKVTISVVKVTFYSWKQYCRFFPRSVESVGVEGMRASSRFKLISRAVSRIQADSGAERLLHQ